ncbi:MAG: hypothetical protein LBB84_04755 [Tannerellaceae bacterium]|jgi:hypothetical protein|nr:hypothetical protein [Tannerellaceae bacterium]
MEKKLFFTLICFIAISWARPVEAAEANRKQDNIEVNTLIGHWRFEKAEILEKQPNAPHFTVKETISRIADMQTFAFCFYQALTHLDFISENRLMFESLDTPTTETDYRLIPQDNGDTLLEIFIQKEDREIPIPTGFEYKISLAGTDRLAITVETVCLNGEFIAVYLTRSMESTHYNLSLR